MRFGASWKNCHCSSQRDARALAQFKRIFDAKQPDGVTDWEKWWAEIVKPLLQISSVSTLVE